MRSLSQRMTELILNASDWKDEEGREVDLISTHVFSVHVVSFIFHRESGNRRPERLERRRRGLMVSPNLSQLEIIC